MQPSPNVDTDVALVFVFPRAPQLSWHLPPAITRAHEAKMLVIMIVHTYSTTYTHGSGVAAPGSHWRERTAASPGKGSI